MSMPLPGAAVGPAPTTFDNSTLWFNLSSWTYQHIKSSVNVTRYAPSFEDLLLAGPRMLTRLGSIISFPETAEGFGQRAMTDPTGSEYILTTAASAVAAPGLAAEASASLADVLNDQDPATLASRFSLEGSRGLGSVFSYATSKWALCCIAMAIVLNRTHIFAASRRRLRLRWPIRVLLRILPIVLFLYQIRHILQSIQCQTSPEFSELRWGNSSKSSELMFAHPVGYLHTASQTLLFGAGDYESCRSVNMIPADEDDHVRELRGSLNQLWPLFGTFCLSHFLETISCAVQGRPIAVETGMTLFEHSLAFAEADAAISNQLGWGLFSGQSPTSPGPSSGSSSSSGFQQSSGSTIAISRAMIMKRVNTSPEVLLVALLSAMSHVTSHILGIFNLQAKFRLISTGFFAFCFMSALVIEATSFSLDDPVSMGLFRFPTVCIIGFIPHIMVFAGIVVCFTIYSLALGLSALSPPDGQDSGEQLTYRQRLWRAHGNMQANISLSDIRITWEMDFYTALLRLGFAVITMASEAVYLNEDQTVNLKARTWLEEERYRELENLRMQWAGSGMATSRYDSVGTIGLVPVKDGQLGASSGYARERAAQKIPKGRMGDRRSRDGVGAAERSSRWLLALEFLMNINRLFLRWAAVVMLKGLARLGVRTQPSFLLWLTRRPKTGKKEERQLSENSSSRALFGNDGQLALRNEDYPDVEAELRRRFQRSSDTANLTESEMDSRLYRVWKYGKLWGTEDTSGNWEPEEDNDDWDTTSLMHSTIGDYEDNSDVQSEGDPWVDEDNDDGRRTPTQRSPLVSRESTPFDQPMAMSDLARLLHPTSPEERQEAHALAAHLQSDRIMTRSQYARLQHTRRGKLLTAGPRGPAKLTPEEEAELLEQLIISRRLANPAAASSGDAANTWLQGASGMGENGPQCVVCHSSSRTIIVWPCRCLSLCDECRVTLAMNNFDKCVCCRREVISFSRIYVP